MKKRVPRVVDLPLEHEVEMHAEGKPGTRARGEIAFGAQRLVLVVERRGERLFALARFVTTDVAAEDADAATGIAREDRK